MYSDLDLKILVKFTKTLKILYVEDNEDSREALGNLLSNFFSDIIFAFNGEDALEKFHNNKVDLVITDIRMPKMNGIDLMLKIREIDEDMPIIVSTAHQEQELIIQCIEIGINGYLLKPINHKQLTRAIKYVCGRLYYVEETKKYERSLENLVRIRTLELEKIQENLTIMVNKDPLTQLYNRRYLHEIISTLIHIASREKNGLSILMIDIDKFKNVNDTYGHLIGDIVLKDLAKKLKQTTRESDVLIRYGGEEFIILLPNTLIDGAKKIADKIRKTIEEATVLVEHSSMSIKYTISIGVTQCNCALNTDENTLINHADKAMYKAKKEGRNKVVVLD